MPKNFYNYAVPAGRQETRESCGLFGIFGHKDVSYLTYLGLYALQHRGEESAGIVTTDGENFFSYKGMGLVADVFDEEKLGRLKGHIAIGHTRYSTTGSSLLKNAQPIIVEYQKGSLAIAHNGNLINSSKLRSNLEKRGSIFQTTCDSEIVLHLMARSRDKSLTGKLTYALEQIEGAYCFLILTEDTLVAVRDPHGFRPLVLGNIDEAYCFASETCAFDLVEAQYLREVEPGEIVIINKEGGLRSFKPESLKSKRCAHCIFEHIYFSRPDSVVFSETVHLVRQRLGQALAREHPIDADMVVPVPDSGSSAAVGFAHATGIPLEIGIIRNHYVGRTFIQPYQHIRDLGVKVKFNLLKEVIKNKRVVIVDDSIVRGTTSKKRVKDFRIAGAKEVHMRISCPPHKFPCFYGIDFPTKDELLANRYTTDEIKKYLDVDSIGYLSLEGMLSCVSQPKENYCVACFTGDYPIKPEKRLGKFSLEKCCGQGDV